MATHELDQLHVTNPTNETFTVKWGGKPYTLEPGEKKIWLRFLAQHFAKHLTNAILLRKEKAHKDAYLASGGNEKDYMPKSFVDSRSLRPQTIDSILIGVYSYHQGSNDDPNAMIQQQIDQMNPQQPAQKERELNAGEAVDPLYGVMKKDKPDTNQVPTPPTDGVSMIPNDPGPPPAPPATPPTNIPTEDPANSRNMKDLMAEAKKLDITVPFGSNKDQVRELIRKQYA